MPIPSKQPRFSSYGPTLVQVQAYVWKWALVLAFVVVLGVVGWVVT
jgi:hypothetical protein